MTTLALSDESAENLQCDIKNTSERKREREREKTTTNPNNNLLRQRRQYASIIKMFVCVGKQLKMNGQKKKRSNKQTATTSDNDSKTPFK